MLHCPFILLPFSSSSLSNHLVMLMHLNIKLIVCSVSIENVLLQKKSSSSFVKMYGQSIHECIPTVIKKLFIDNKLRKLSTYCTSLPHFQSLLCAIWKFCSLKLFDGHKLLFLWQQLSWFCMTETFHRKKSIF